MQKFFYPTSFLFLFVFAFYVSSPAIAEDDKDNVSAPSNNYELTLKKLIDQSEGNLKDLNSKIKEEAVSKSRSIREDRAKEYYEKGLQLTEEGKFEQARFYFDKAVKVSERSELLDNIKQSQERLRKQELALRVEKEKQLKEQKLLQKELEEGAENLYERAISLFRQKRYLESKDLFENIQKLIKNYRSTDSYLKSIDERVAEEKERQSKKENEENEIKSKQLKEKEEIARKKIESEKQRQEQEALIAQVDVEYKAALDLYSREFFNLAKDKFEAVSNKLPGYKLVDSYLRKIDKDILQKEKKEEALKLKAIEEQRSREELKKIKEEEASKLKEQERLRNLERQHKEEELAKKKEEERKRLEELEKQKALERQKKLEEQALKKQEETKRLEEQEKQKALERQKRLEEQALKKQEETKRFEEQEKQKALERQRKLEEEAKAKEEEKRKRQEEQEKLKAKELERKQELEAKKQREEQARLQDIEIKKQLEEKRKKDEEFKEELERKRIAEVERLKLLELQRKQEQELAKKQELEIKKQQQVKDQEAKNEAEKLYQQAIDLYRQKNFVQSKDLFFQVEKIVDNYRSTRFYIDSMDQRIAAQQALEAKKQKEEQERLQALEVKKQKEEKERQERIVKENQVKEQERLKKEAFLKQEQEKQELINKVDVDYLAAENLYRQEQYQEAKEKFESVSKQLPRYKSTDRYLRNIQKNILNQQRVAAEKKQRELREAKIQEEKQKKLQESKSLKIEVGKVEKVEKEKVQDNQQETLEQQKLLDDSYLKAVNLYKQKDFQSAKKAFESIAINTPNYKSLQYYLRLSNKAILQQEILEKKHQLILKQQQEKDIEIENKRKQEQEKQNILQQQKQNNKTEERSKKDVESSVYVEVKKVKEQSQPTQPNNSDDKQQASEIQLLNELAKKSSQLFNEIADIADDKQTMAAKSKLAKVDQTINKLRLEKEKHYRKQREEEEKKRQQEFNEKRQLRVQQAESLYSEALSFLKAKSFSEAKRKFLELENVFPNYKSTKNYLANIDQDQIKVEQEAIAEKTKEEEKLRAEQEAKRKQLEKEERRNKIEQLKQRLAEIVQNASAINDDILNLTKEKNYVLAKSKFDELEQALSNLKIIKQKIARETDQLDLESSQSKEQELIKRESQRVLKEKRAELYKTENSENILKERKKQKDIESKQVSNSRNNELKQQKEIIYRQGVELYSARKYDQAKIIFGELASQGDERALSYLRKIDRQLQETVLREKNSVEKERTNYLAERLRQQRLSDLMGVKEHERQKHLTQEMERQRNLLDKEKQEENRKIELIKLEERKRKSIEKQKLKIEEQERQKEQIYRFRKLKPASKEKIEKENRDVKAKQKEIKHIPEVAKEPDIKIKDKNDEALKIQQEKSKRDQELLDIQKRKQNKEKALEELEKQKENEQKSFEESKKQKEADRSKELENKRLQAEQNEKERLEKAKAEQLAKKQEKERLEVEKAVRQQQINLEAQRKTIQQELLKGVDAMYTEAVKLYKTGDYQGASSRFSDIEDLMPNYKKTKEYLSKSTNELNQPAKVAVKKIIPVVKQKNLVLPNQHITSQALSPSTRKDEIAKTLDLFDSKVK